ncbi:hypothetical protein CANINC_004584 [Pichia inconspicua]|uniref:Uncharacterized protein n=1 Tax=Pichia inconspicua TaxID=52247 RepID=A0A4T0WVP7_9ASCO|nr:hypothetical protein CANINC_004584 [[Candida] inconspicua]
MSEDNDESSKDLGNNDFVSSFDDHSLNLAHQTKTPSTSNVPQIPQLDIENEPEFNVYSNATHQHTEYTGIHIDNAIKDKISSAMIPSYDDQYYQEQDYYDTVNQDPYQEMRIDYYTDLTKMERKDFELPVFLPIRSDLFESYLSPLLMIFSQVPMFSNLILSHQFLTFPYKPNWWNRERCSDNLMLLQEIQRLVAFLNGHTIRAFASIFNLEQCISKLVKEEFETVNEFFDFFVNELKISLKEINSRYGDAIDDLFDIGLVEGQVGPQTEGNLPEHHVFEIPVTSETIGLDIYHTLYSCFTQASQAIDSPSYIWIDKVPTLIVIFFEPGIDEIEGGFKLDEIFYPQIFMYQHRDIISLIEKEIIEIKQLQRELSRKSFALRAYQGKSVHGFLVQAKDYLKQKADYLNKERSDDDHFNDGDKVESASDNIDQVNKQIKIAIQSIDDEMKQLNERLSYLQNNKLNIDVLLDAEKKIEFDPSILIGVILSHNHFFYKVKKSEVWMGVSIDDETCKAYEVREVDYSFVENTTLQYTESDFGDGMTLVYVKKSEFYSVEFSPLNSILKDFIDKDNKRLRDQLDYFNASNVDTIN